MHTNMHTTKRVHDHADTSILWCPLELNEVKGYAFIFIGLRCLEIFHLFLPPARPPNRSWCCSNVPQPPFSTSFHLPPCFSFSLSADSFTKALIHETDEKASFDARSDMCFNRKIYRWKALAMGFLTCTRSMTCTTRLSYNLPCRKRAYTCLGGTYSRD